MNYKAFTLIETLLVITIIGSLSAITLAAINPSKQIEESNEATRASDVKQIQNAIIQYQIDNRGNLPDGLDEAYDAAGNCPFTLPIQKTASYTPETEFDLCPLVPEYLAEVPLDPSYKIDGVKAANQPYFNSCDDYFTGYTLKLGDEDTFNYLNPPAVEENRIAIIKCTDSDANSGGIGGSLPAGNIITDADMEDPSTDLWSYYGASSYIDKVKTADSHTGSLALAVSIDSSYSSSLGVQKTNLNLEPGETYELAFWYKSNSFLIPRIGINTANSDFEQLTYLYPQENWTRYTRTFTAPSTTINTTQLVFYLGKEYYDFSDGTVYDDMTIKNSGDIYMDNIKVAGLYPGLFILNSVAAPEVLIDNVSLVKK